MNRHTEHFIQSEFFSILRKMAFDSKIPGLLASFAIPNGAFLPKVQIVGSKKSICREIGKLKAEGLLPGVPDVFIPIVTANFGGLFIEFKSATGTLSKRQKEIHSYLKESGYSVQVARSAQGGIDIVLDYIDASS